MAFKELLMAQPARLWKFLGFFQPPFLRVLHMVVIVLVLIQLVTSLGMSAYLYSAPGLNTGISDVHLYLGLACAVIFPLFTLYCWRMRGLHRFYGYLWGDTEQLRKDILDSLRFKLVPPRPGGLATVVQGLGFGAMLLAAFSGALWFLALKQGWGSAHVLKEAHEFCANILVLYLCGHGGMALLHFIIWQRTVPGNKSEHA